MRLITGRNVLTTTGSVLLGVALSVALMVGATSQAAIPSNGVITACYVPGGNLRVIDPAKERCRTGERQLTWSDSGGSGGAGPTGPTGPMGPPGNDGTSGTSGTDGAPGSNGTSGTSGTDGAPGSNGTNGTSGTSGTDGATGPTGPTGPSGPSGPTGASGPSGPPGVANVYLDGTLQPGTVVQYGERSPSAGSDTVVFPRAFNSQPYCFIQIIAALSGTTAKIIGVNSTYFMATFSNDVWAYHWYCIAAS